MKKYDLIVAGGGISGVAAATCAAREGISVLLVEKAGVLGGAMSLSLVYPFMKFRTEQSGRILSDGIFTEMRERHAAYGDTSWETFKFVFDDMLTQAGADILFYADITEVKTEGRAVKSVTVSTKCGKEEIEADFFIDCTGDGDVIFMAGCDTQLGRESDGLCQPMTTCFRVANIDTEIFYRDRPMLQEKYKQLQAEGKITNPRENILCMKGLGDGIIHFNTTRVIKLDPTSSLDLSRAEIMARAQVHEIMDFFREHSEAFKNCVLISVANNIGVRESRKLRGEHILTGDEIKNCVYFDDAIALGNYEIDIHNPEGSGTTLYYFKDEEFYSIPYRSLLPKEYDNLLVAGRCLSATHEAHSAVRIMPICATLGQAAGTAAALCVKNKNNAKDIDINALRNLLTENGAAL